MLIGFFFNIFVIFIFYFSLSLLHFFIKKLIINFISSIKKYGILMSILKMWVYNYFFKMILKVMNHLIYMQYPKFKTKMLKGKGLKKKKTTTTLRVIMIL